MQRHHARDALHEHFSSLWVSGHKCCARQYDTGEEQQAEWIVLSGNRMSSCGTVAAHEAASRRALPMSLEALWLAGEEMYIAMDKGAINKTHVLLLPIDHVSSTLELRPAQYAELDRFLSALREYFSSQVRVERMRIGFMTMSHNRCLCVCDT